MILMAVLAIFSCTPESAELPPTPEAQLVSIRVMNADLNHQNMSVRVNGAEVHSNLAYGSLSAYNKYDPPGISLTLFDAGEPYFSTDIKINERLDFTLIPFKVNDTTSQMLRIYDLKNTDPNKADLKCFNFNFTDSQYDLRIGAPAGEIIIDSLTYSNLEPNGATRNRSFPLDEGNYTFAFTNTADGSLAHEFEPVFLEGGKVYYLTIFGDGNQTFTKAFESNGLSGSFIELKEPAPKVMFVNMLKPDEEVDVYLNGTKGAVLAYSENSDYLIGNNNSNSITVMEANTTNQLLSLDFDLEEKLRKTVIGYKTQESYDYKVFEDSTSLTAIGKTKIRFINMTDLPGLSLKNDGSSLLDNIASRESSEFLEIESENYKFEIYNEAGVAISKVREIEVPANKIITFIAYKLATKDGEFEYALKRIDY